LIDDQSGGSQIVLGSQVQEWTQMQMLLHMWMMNWEADQQGIQDTDLQSAAAVFFRSVSSREREAHFPFCMQESIPDVSDSCKEPEWKKHE
jgi:hypothetical protein